jgi:hypothetical protein
VDLPFRGDLVNHMWADDALVAPTALRSPQSFHATFHVRLITSSERYADANAVRF